MQGNRDGELGAIQWPSFSGQVSTEATKFSLGCLPQPIHSLIPCLL